MFDIKVLDDFRGTEYYHKHWTGKFVMTDGANYIQDGAGWLTDIIANVQHYPAIATATFQLWELVKNEDGSALVTVKEDSDKPVLYQQKIDTTDFPLKEFKLYLIDDGQNKVLLLPSEY